MLVIARYTDERVRIGDDIEIVIVRVQDDGRVYLGIQAPPGVAIARDDMKKRRS